MMPVQQFSEPAGFDAKVRLKGLKFLATTPDPTSSEWSKHAYWQDILPDMRRMYHGICNYCATWIPHGTGQHSIDHFLDKDSNPARAYEWQNYRYASARFNSRKGSNRILDPIGLALEIFILNMNNFFIEPNPGLTDISTIQDAHWTIKILKFNEDEDLVRERQTFILDYKNGEITFDYLGRNAPFIAYEISRQGLKIK